MYDILRTDKDDLSVVKKTTRWYLIWHGTTRLLITEKFLFWGDEKVIFAWYFWVSHNIPGIKKNSFWCIVCFF